MTFQRPMGSNNRRTGGDKPLPYKEKSGWGWFPSVFKGPNGTVFVGAGFIPARISLNCKRLGSRQGSHSEVER